MKSLSKTLLVGLTALFLFTGCAVTKQPVAEAVPGPVVANSVAEAEVAVKSKCKVVCLILDEADVNALSAQVDAAIQEAYQAGLKGWSKAS